MTMTPPTERRAARPLAPARALLPASFFCLLCLGAAPPAQADSPAAAKSSIRSLRTVRTGHALSYDITVTSTAEFPMRDEIVTLAIGGQEFSNSHYLPGGDLNTLVFSLTPQQFQGLQTGAPAVVYYGRDDAAIPKAQWALGTLNKALLDRVLLPAPVKAAPVKAGPAPAVKLPAASQRKGKK